MKKPEPFTPRYKEFSLAEISAEFSPRHVYDNGESFIIHPLPQEGPIAFGIPKVLPVYQTAANAPTLSPVNPTIAFPLVPSVAQNFVNHHAKPTDYAAFFRIGHLIDLTEHGPQHSNAPKYRLDLLDYHTADAFQVIVHYRTSKTTFPALQSALPTNNHRIHEQIDFHRQIISECEYIDHWLIHDDIDWYSDLRKLYIKQHNEYLRKLATHSF